ncbi:hypothetical protein [Planctomycetes bacterium K23_9]|uniref:Uncharacterized protein n=1 Tax=Stieleria marina TaxID=1930275 RepID=A0A517NLV9_9BACT|nr:hypothetical protein K239x_00370 [Planctomycetes bacterium K23_9]
MNELTPEERASEYCEKRDSRPDFDNLLGTGQEGSVWPTTNKTAIKVFDREQNFNSELGCYEILAEHGVFEIDGFTIPHLIGSDRELLIVEMTIVAPPFILDFGKAYINCRPDFDDSVMEYYEQERTEMFEGNWDLVDSAVSSLEQFGIFYWDARPGNIDCRNHPLATFK